MNANFFSVPHYGRSILLWLSAIAMLFASSCFAASVMVWSQKDGADINIYFSPDGTRVAAITSIGINLAPNVFRSKSSTWIAWVDKTGGGVDLLKIARLSSAGNLQNVQILASVNGSAYAPAISVDSHENRVWLVWAEHLGRTEVLYASYRDLKGRGDSGWQPAIQITQENDYSANVPVIDSVSYDRIRISWERTSPVSSGSASTEIHATDWPINTSQMSVDSTGLLRIPGRLVTVQASYDSDQFVRELKGKSIGSDDEIRWERLTRDRQVITGAIHSDTADTSMRLMDVRR